MYVFIFIVESAEGCGVRVATLLSVCFGYACVYRHLLFFIIFFSIDFHLSYDYRSSVRLLYPTGDISSNIISIFSLCCHFSACI